MRAKLAPTMCRTFSVPARLPPSCPPPRKKLAIGVPLRTYSAATPCGSADRSRRVSSSAAGQPTLPACRCVGLCCVSCVAWVRLGCAELVTHEGEQVHPELASLHRDLADGLGGVLPQEGARRHTGRGRHDQTTAICCEWLPAEPQRFGDQSRAAMQSV